MFLLLHQLHHILPITGATSAAAAVRCLVEYRRRIPIGEMMDMVNRSDQSGSNCSSNSVKMEHGGRVWRFLAGGCLGGGIATATDGLLLFFQNSLLWSSDKTGLIQSRMARA